MRAAVDPVGPDNHEHVMRAVKVGKAVGDVFCAWGVHGSFMDQDRTVMGWLDAEDIAPKAFGLTKAGAPWHPLYKPLDLIPVAYEGRP